MPFRAIARKSQSVFIRFLALALIFESFFVSLAPLPAHAAIADGMPAIDEMGQYDAGDTVHVSPIFTKGGADDSVNRMGLNNATATSWSIDKHHRLYFPDFGNNRVLVWQLKADDTFNSKMPDYVLGQADFNSRAQASSQTGMKNPTTTAYDSVHDRLFVGDYFAHRVLVYDVSSISNGMNAAYVIGQTSFTGAANASTQAGMANPNGLAYDATNQRLFVTDASDNRVTTYDLAGGITNGMNASHVIGQVNFTANGTATTQAGMNGPAGVAVDTSGQRLFVAEYGNNRVTVYSTASISDGENATVVLGQADFTHNSAANTQVGMNNPNGVTFDGSRLFVADYSSNRVLSFNSGSISTGHTADNVLGQANFTSNPAVTTQAGLRQPGGSMYDATNNLLYVADSNNNRITAYPVSSITNGENASDVIGQYDASSTSLFPTTGIYTKQDPNNGPNRFGFNMNNASSITIDSHHHLFVPDANNNRILVYNLNTDDTLPDKVADYVLGQANFNANVATTNQSSLRSPAASAYDAAHDRLFVADYDNNRVMVYDLSGGISSGMNAQYVIGEANFTASDPGGTTQAGTGSPTAVVYDAANQRLFVAEADNSRVTVWDLSGGITNGMNAQNVLGQTSFSANGHALTQSAFYAPRGLAYNAAGSRLFVADFNQNRVMVFNTSSISNGMNAVNVIGEPDFTTNTGPTTQAGLNQPIGLIYDAAHTRLFVGGAGASRVMVFNVSSISDGMNAANVIGKPDFTTGGGQTTASGTFYPRALGYDATNQRLYVGDVGNSRVMIFDANPSTGTTSATVSDSITMSRLKAGSTATISITFNLNHNLSSTLTVNFPSGFAVTNDTSGMAAASSSCLGSFNASNPLQVTASKTNCAGPITLGGIIVTLPNTPGTYQITWVNDDPGGGSIIVTSEDQISITASVDPSITFNVGSQASATACDGTFSGNGGTVGLGVITTSAVTSSDASSVPHICTRVSTNATSGGIVTVKSLNASLKSTTVPADAIPSNTATLTAGTEGYGLCAGSVAIDFGTDVTTPTGSTPSATSPFASTCTTSAHNVGHLTTSAQQVWSIAGPSSNAFYRLYLKAAIAGTTRAHTDYTDTLTFVATGTF